MQPGRNSVLQLRFGSSPAVKRSMTVQTAASFVGGQERKTMAEIYDGAPCKKCGSPMLTDGDRLWCCSVGSEGAQACSYGQDTTVKECYLCFGKTRIYTVSRDSSGVKHHYIWCFLCKGEGVIELKDNQ